MERVLLDCICVGIHLYEIHIALMISTTYTTYICLNLYRAAGSERLMFPVERYLWLFPNDVRRLVGGAQQREGYVCVLLVLASAVEGCGCVDWWWERGVEVGFQAQALPSLLSLSHAYPPRITIPIQHESPPNKNSFFPSSHHFLQGVWIALFLCVVRFVLDRALFMVRLVIGRGFSTHVHTRHAR